MDHDTISKNFKYTLESLDFVCLSLLVCEIIIKLFGMNLK